MVNNMKYVVLAAALCATCECVAQTVSTCKLTVPETIKRGSASFADVFSFSVDSQGRPTNIRPVNAPFVSSDEVKACICSWRFPSEEGDKLTTSFEWKHGMGWTTLTVSGPRIKLLIKFSQ